MKSFVLMRNTWLFTVKEYPKFIPNPVKFRWAIYRDGSMIGAARTKKEAESRIVRGDFDAYPT
jgi:hypothetical protein